MKTDINGCSTTQSGTEHFETYRSSVTRKVRVQYDYRTHDGRLFSTIATSLEAAREKRDEWLKKEVAL